VYLPAVVKNLRAPLGLFVVAYRPTNVPGYTPPSATYIQSITQQTMGDLRTASIWHGYTITSGIPSIQYSLTLSGVVVVNSFPPTQTASGYLNLNTIYQQFNICNRVASGEIDEVWVWADGGSFHPPYAPSEFAINGPIYSFNATNFQTPNCSETVTTMFFNYDTPYVENAIESYGHTFEYAMAAGFYPYGNEECDWGSATVHSGYFTAGRPGSWCTGTLAPSDTYAFTNRAAPENNYVAICGDIHQAPNAPITITQDLYLPDLSTSVPSRCMDWQWGGGTIANVNRDTWGAGCTSWSCFHRKYMIWWMQNIPGVNNTNKGRSGSNRPDWWMIKVKPESYNYP
jgi:hypothetical protein